MAALADLAGVPELRDGLPFGLPEQADCSLPNEGVTATLTLCGVTFPNVTGMLGREAMSEIPFYAVTFRDAPGAPAGAFLGATPGSNSCAGAIPRVSPALSRSSVRLPVKQ